MKRGVCETEDSKPENNPEVNVEVTGHTDSVGTTSGNYNLSVSRANAVKAYLVEYGISRSRITTRGEGETKPVEKNSTEAGRAKNRRVEFLFRTTE